MDVTDASAHTRRQTADVGAGDLWPNDSVRNGDAATKGVISQSPRDGLISTPDSQPGSTILTYQARKPSNDASNRSGSSNRNEENDQRRADDSRVTSISARARRTSIPIRPNHSLNLWSFLKNAIGKELTKIPIPVNFNEPLSMLQRITEDLEYADLLHKAAKITDSCEQLAYVAAFCASHYATTSVRTGKPFNPLLGETFECDRTDDLGWKSIAEQVSHHPPMLAMHVEGRGWTAWSEFGIASKFRGKYLQVMPIDISHLRFEGSGNHYTWRKITTTVHNIIVGKLWIDNSGEQTITNHVTGDKCHLKFSPYSYFSRDLPRKITGVVVDKDNVAKWILSGAWDSKLEAAKVVGSRNLPKGKPVLETTAPKPLWQRVLPDEKYDKMYCMTPLAVQLNEPEDGVAPTDSRFRPDQREMENGNWDEANRLKTLLEENQRARRRQRDAEEEMAAATGKPLAPYEPLWFKKTTDPQTGNEIFVYNGEYWKAKERQDWSRCPDIYNLEPS